MSAVLEHIAKVCHEANRAWCEVNGDTSQAAWEHAADWQRESSIAGVKAALDGATPEELHEKWCEYKLNDGWTYGTEKDGSKKTHPCLVPYEDLPEEQRRKDALFSAIVIALR